jgi:para-aminobenzoate synthetase component 1
MRTSGKRDFDHLASREYESGRVETKICRDAGRFRHPDRAGNRWRLHGLRPITGLGTTMGTAAVILLEHGPTGMPAVFSDPEAVIIAERAAEVGPALAAAERARRNGAWVAGYVAYEAGFALEPRLARLMPRRRPGPLVALGLFAGPAAAGPVLARAGDEGKRTEMTAPVPALGRRAYGNAARKVFDYIAAGDCYQVNLTFPMTARLVSGTPLGLYGAFRRTGVVGHGAYVDLGVGPVIVSRSPELFFRLETGGRIVARPMKGTAPRDPDPARDARIAAALQASVKDRAENLMIVDLLRNDIARIARIGSVKVPALFAMERYSTVHQMTSTIEGQLAAAPSLPALMAALFPCGSVTGAPKIRAMEIIREVEPAPRGIYCGAIGWMSPGGEADFSVAIRTLSVTGRDIVMNVGGGLTHGSTATGEWEEALWKARFVKAAVSRD